MAKCPSQVFTSVSPAAWEDLKTKAAGAGIALNADAGTLSKSGFTIEWSYDAADRSLTVTCTKAPFFLKCDAINAKMRESIEQQLAETPSSSPRE